MDDYSFLYSSYRNIPELRVPDFLDVELYDLVKSVVNESSVFSFEEYILRVQYSRWLYCLTWKGDAHVVKAKIQLGIQVDAMNALNDLSIRLSLLNDFISDESALNELSLMVSELEMKAFLSLFNVSFLGFGVVMNQFGRYTVYSNAYHVYEDNDEQLM